MGKHKKNRCRIPTCGLVIKTDYQFCYMHRKCSIKGLVNLHPGAPLIPSLRRFFCNTCGTSVRQNHHADCHYCGGKTEEVGD